MEMTLTSDRSTAREKSQGFIQANPLIPFVWGVEPRNGRRMRRALLMAAGPGAVYLLLVCCLAGWQVYDRFPRNLHSLLEYLWISSFFAGLGATGLFLIFLTVQSKRPRQFRDNWEQCSLAGMTAGQMLFGIGSPVIAGGVLLAAVHSCLLFSHYFCMVDDFRELTVVFGVTGLFPIGAIVIYIIVDLAMWILAPSFAARAAAGLIAGFVTSVFVWLIGLVFLSEITSIRFPNAWFNNLHSVLLCEAILWPIRAIAACWLLRFAIRKLDHGAKRTRKKEPDAAALELRKTLLIWGALWIAFNLALLVEGLTCLEIVQAFERRSGHDCPGLNGDTLRSGQIIVGAAANAVFLLGPLIECFARLSFGVRLRWSRLALLAGTLLLPAWWILEIFWETVRHVG